MDTEALRNQHKPKKVKLLLVAESPPPEKGVFFYEKDKKCNMKKFTAQVFGEYFFGDSNKFENNDSDFFHFFMDKGCFLEDLCKVPIDKKENRERKWEESIPEFAVRLKEINPEIVVPVLIGIKEHVLRAVEMAGILPIRECAIPFAGNGWQNKYRKKLTKILQRHYPNKA